MKRNLHLHVTISLFFILQALSSHTAAQTFTKYVISFTDKKGSTYQLSQPQQFLSQRAIERRRRHNIAIDSTDLPVLPRYLDSIRSVPNVNILYTSRWFNQAVIQTSDAQSLLRIRLFSFVESTAAIAARQSAGTGKAPVKNNVQQTTGDKPIYARGASFDYGYGYGQINIHEGIYLHDKGFSGEGMLIAVLDGGFPGVNNAGAFSHLFSNSRIRATYDFVNGSTDVYKYSTHGTHCLSTMAAEMPEMTGTAPNASYVLLRTEEDGKEQPVEENNWVAGAEFADSAGADLISSSLGYSTFDNPVFNHTYFDLNGDATIVTQAADLAARKGMIVVNSAGNEGSSSWVYITPPADGDSVLAVGAVNAAGQPAAFSSYGPVINGVVKPDVMGVGVATQIVSSDGKVATGSGTSFSTPIVAGLVACLWQAFPQRSNMEILNVVKASSSRFTTPDDQMGYGIPNFRIAYDSLYKRAQQDTVFIRGMLQDEQLKVTPNPFYRQLYVYYQSVSNQPVYLSLSDNLGKMVAQRRFEPGASTYGHYLWQDDKFGGLPAGIYYLQLLQGDKKSTAKLVKL